MPIKNETRVLADDERNKFKGEPDKVILTSGTELYKYTEYALRNPVTEWWMAVNPPWPGDPGLRGHLVRASGAATSGFSLARAGAAVPHGEGNRMTDLVIVRLLVATYAWKGPTRHQPFTKYDDKDCNVVLIGGRIQVFVPDLALSDVTQLSGPR